MDDLKRTVRRDFEEVRAQLPDALKSEGFGIITEIDMKATLEIKLGADFRRYRIVGACIPSLVKRALEADLDVGRFLPCNVVLYEDDRGDTTVLAVDPLATLASARANEDIAALAADVRARLRRVLAALH
jgi:uncharacterized protein (DUF302 family)